MKMHQEALQEWVENISSAFFDKPFRHEARFNARLQTTGGRYLLKTHDIEINPKHFAALGRGEVEGIIKHELCHYHLHIEGKGYLHRDKDFKLLMKQVDAPRHCSRLPNHVLKTRKRSHKRYRYLCLACGHQYVRKRRMDPNRYRCGVCRGNIQQIEGDRVH